MLLRGDGLVIAHRAKRIGLNLLYLRPGHVGGGETYARGLISGFKELGTGYEFVVFLNEIGFAAFPDLEQHPQFKRVKCNVSLNAPLRHLWESLRFNQLARQHRLDLLHSLGNVTPFAVSCPTAVTIHDVRYKAAPKSLNFDRRVLLGGLTTSSARRADIILTVSHTSERHILQYLNVPSSKIIVTPEGPGQDLSQDVTWEDLQQRHKVPRSYFLTVGLAPHKRLDLILEAARIARRDLGLLANIVTTSSIGPIPANSDLATHLGYVPAADLAALYKHAIALICFSDLEGFGLTAVEAMQVGTPVISANSTSLPEVVGEGGLLVEPGNAAALANAMRRLATDAALHADLSRRALRQVAHFSWKECAALTIAAYERVINSNDATD